MIPYPEVPTPTKVQSLQRTLYRKAKERGWLNYFHYGNNTKVFGCIRQWVEQRVRTWLWGKYDRKLGCYTFFTSERIYGQYQLWKMPTTAGWTR